MESLVQEFRLRIFSDILVPVKGYSRSEVQSVLEQLQELI